MAYTLKSSGLATALTFCIAVDQDGTTIREFVSTSVNSDMTRDSAVTVSSATWKGTSRGFFETYIGSGGDGFNFQGLRFGTNKPVFSAGSSDADGLGLFIAFAGVSSGGGARALISTTGFDAYLERNSSSGLPGMNVATLTRGSGTTAYPAGTTKFSSGVNYVYNANCDFYYGLESGSLAADGTNNPGINSINGPLAYVGGYPGQGHVPAKYFVIAGFSRKLTLAEYQSLHDDWFGTLFVSPPTAPSGVTVGSITTTGATVSWTDASSDETGFKVEYAPSPFSSWTAASGSPAAANATSLALGAVLSPGTTYKARVASTNANGDSAWAESSEFTTASGIAGRALLLGVG